jgi:hypothetical protein
MPLVVIYHRPWVNDTSYRRRRNIDDFWGDVKGVVRTFGVEKLQYSTLKEPIASDDFSFVIVQVAEPGELTHDMIVTMHLHAFEDRVERADDNAMDLADRIWRAISEKCAFDRLTIGVALMHSQFGWGRMIGPKSNLPEGPFCARCGNVLQQSGGSIAVCPSCGWYKGSEEYDR